MNRTMKYKEIEILNEFYDEHLFMTETPLSVYSGDLDYIKRHQKNINKVRIYS